MEQQVAQAIRFREHRRWHGRNLATATYVVVLFSVIVQASVVGAAARRLCATAPRPAPPTANA